MSQSAVLRAAGAYADEIAKHLGLLTLKASVLAGLRIQDGNKYAPDERLIPRDPQRLHTQLRDAWTEYSSLGRDLGAYLEDREQIEVRLDKMSQTDSWNDALALAVVAAELRQWDPLARVTLSANCLRAGMVDAAHRSLTPFLMLRGSLRRSTMSRLLRNRAGVEEARGNKEEAVSLAREASLVAPECTLSRFDYFAYEAKLHHHAVSA